ncbi:MAG: SCO family protein [Gammaproteobacteria bacterium]|nr:SCO family protein [Gammaproteobacteria bacterium]
MPKQRSLIMLIGTVLGITALFTGLYLGGAFRKPLTELTVATLYPDSFRKLEDFALSDQHGQTYSLNELRGHWSLLFFGYSYCPDICPNTLYMLNQVDKLINTDATAYPVKIVFISVDPARDTPDRLKEYVGYFNPRFVGLTGAQEQVDKLVTSLGVYYRKQESTDRNTYLVDHSAGLFLFNPAAKPQALFSAPHDAEKLAHDILLITQYFGNHHA